ncbi:ABC transporter substrate-binding protein [Cohnella kolymensis]|uniref:ABC transporter substrate-binding protein n=1 Tax=Cohnella kolymensis TaxID=1590652 RepID=A0ABR5A335_9BACL|nr:ABC transporter substrate-binding protein [Cohnella kolymensis]KIL35473.1 ABC transporter substrate-binding protein [Cohnella kolymensis]
MKRLLTIGLVLGMVSVAACGVPNPKASDEAAQTNESEKVSTEITIASNGGKVERAIRDVIAPKFKEKYGIKVNYIAGLSSENLSKVELQKNAPQIDIAMYAPLDVQRAYTKGLTEPLDEKSIPNLSKVDPRFVAVDKVGLPVFGYVYAPAYNTETFEKNGIGPVNSWNDLVRAEYKGKTAYADITSDFGFATFYSLAKANGGSLDNLEPGLEKAKELAGYSDTFYKNSTQMIPAMQQGAADITVLTSYSIAELIESGVPLKMALPKEGVPLQAANFTIVKNAPNKKAAQDFLNFLITEESQKLFAEEAFYPVLKGMKVAPKYEASIGLKDTDPVFSPDVVKLGEIRAAWTERYAKEVTPELGKKVKK